VHRDGFFIRGNRIAAQSIRRRAKRSADAVASSPFSASEQQHAEKRVMYSPAPGVSPTAVTAFTTPLSFMPQTPFLHSGDEIVDEIELASGVINDLSVVHVAPVMPHCDFMRTDVPFTGSSIPEDLTLLSRVDLEQLLAQLKGDTARVEDEVARRNEEMTVIGF